MSESASYPSKRWSEGEINVFLLFHLKNFGRVDVVCGVSLCLLRIARLMTSCRRQRGLPFRTQWNAMPPCDGGAGHLVLRAPFAPPLSKSYPDGFGGNDWEFSQQNIVITTSDSLNSKQLRPKENTWMFSIKTSLLGFILTPAANPCRYTGGWWFSWGVDVVSDQTAEAIHRRRASCLLSRGCGFMSCFLLLQP